MSPVRFCVSFVVSALGVAGTLAAFNVLVDPYLVFGGPRIAGLNAVKPSVMSRERLMKAYDAPRHDAATFILGSSRSDIGLDPADAAWPASSRPVYNLSLAGSGVGTAFLYLQHTVALRPSSIPRTIVVGLDFEFALTSPQPIEPRVERPVVLSETEQRMAVLRDGSANAARRERMAKDVLLASFSLDSLTDSVRTVVANRGAGSSDLEANGHMSEADFRRVSASDGVGALFSQKNRQFVREVGAERLVLRTAADGSLESLVAVGALMGFAQAHGIAVVAFIQPAHADRLELIDRLGYWDVFERWKTALTQLVAARQHEGAHVDLWDFADYEVFSLEPVPAASDRKTSLRWFWEPAHYKAALGDLMIRRMMEEHPADGIGVKLVPGNIEGHLANIRAARTNYREHAPEATARLEETVCALRPCQARATATR